MSAHTPGPWAVSQNFNGIFGRWMNPGLEPIGFVYHPAMPDKSEVGARAMADAQLIAAAPELLAAQTMGAEVNTPGLLEWVADRLVHVYGESPNVDFVQSLRARAVAGRAAISKATGQPLIQS